MGNVLIKTAKLLANDISPQSAAVVIAATRSGTAKFVAPTARVDSTVALGQNSSVWFNAKIGAGTKIGAGACVLDGASVEENCVLGEMCVVKPGAVVKKGSTLGARVVVGSGAVIPEKSSIKDSTVLVEGWNGKSVQESTQNPTLAEEEASHMLHLATEHQTAWSRPLEEREETLKSLIYAYKNPPPGEKWETFVSVNPNPNRNPERRGLLYDK